MAPLSIHLNYFDPDSASPELLRNDDKAKFWLLVTEAPMTVAQHATLQTRNIAVDHQYPDHAYVVKVNDAFDSESVKELTFIKHALPFPSDAVLPANLQSKDEQETVDLSITLHTGSSRTPEEMLNDISTITPVIQTSCGDSTIFASVAAGKIPDIAQLDEIRSINFRHDHSPATLVACEVMQVSSKDTAGQLTWNPFTGKDQVIAVCDYGLDNGDKSKLLAAFGDRVIDIVMLSDDTKSVVRDATQLTDPTGHGTHVAACALGRDMRPGSTVDADLNISGTAPGARLFFIKKALVPVDDLLTLGKYSPASGTKASILTNSWAWDYDNPSEVEQRPYDEFDTLPVDKVMFQDPSLLIIFAAGNDGLVKLKQNAQICGPAASKNALVVGACTSTRKFSTDVKGEEIKYDPQHGREERKYIANFSNKGPTYEGFLKPDVVAPGVATLSSRSTTFTGIDAHETHFGKSVDKRFMFASGTSQATPFVAGCAACLREACIAARPSPAAEPSGPLLKALIVNGTNSLVSGTAWLYDPSAKANPSPQISVQLLDAPDYAQGYGMMNLRRSLAPISARAGADKGYDDRPNFVIPAPPAKDPKNPNAPDPEVVIWTQEIKISSPDDTVRATLAYNDRAGAKLNADLALELVLNTKESVSPRMPSPWKDGTGKDVKQPTAFKRGNLQKIVWRYGVSPAPPNSANVPPPTSGKLSIRVKRRDVQSGGKVSFAVVWWVSQDGP